MAEGGVGFGVGSSPIGGGGLVDWAPRYHSTLVKKQRASLSKKKKGAGGSSPLQSPTHKDQGVQDEKEDLEVSSFAEVAELWEEHGDLHLSRLRRLLRQARVRRGLNRLTPSDFVEYLYMVRTRESLN